MKLQMLKSLLNRALNVLKRNDLGNWTKPSPRLYSHQWLWDSVEIAMGLVHIDEKRAWQEILSLLKGQWENGMVPHMIFNPLVQDYNPGSRFWDSRISPNAPQDLLTSGITQPPILAYGVYQVFKNSKDRKQARAFLQTVFPALKRYYRFFFEYRDPNREGLACIIHPWESGLDNSIRWSDPMQRITLEWMPEVRRNDNTIVSQNQRPTDNEYTKYAYLVELFQQERYDQKRILERTPFKIQPILFNSLMYASLSALTEIGRVLSEDISDIEAWVAKTKNSLNTRLWDAERKMYVDYDLATNQPIITNTVAQFIPLFAGVPPTDRAELMAQRLSSPEYWPNHSGYPLCSVAISDPAFEPERMWRGPVWINTNWFVIKGLQRYGYYQVSRQLTDKTLELVQKFGFYEHFNPLTGEGGGAENFSWSASLVIDLIMTYDVE